MITQPCRVNAECLERRLLLSTVSFQPREIYNTGTDPLSVAVADLGNGHPDIVLANNYDNTVSVLLGNGNGTFQPQKVFFCGQAPIAVAIADLGNGHPDLVVANTTANSVNVLLGNGDGTFHAPIAYAAGGNASAVVVADLGNGHPDIVVTNQSDNTVSVLLGNGGGTFQPQRTYATGAAPDGVAIADLGNGHPDIVVANFNDNTASILLGNGDGTFQAQQTVATGTEPRSVAIANLGNGHPDIVVANGGDGTASVLLGNGDGTFQAQKTYATDANPYSVALADLGNGHPDLVVADAGGNDISVLLGNGDGTFQAQQTFANDIGTDSVAVADLGNGSPDIVVAAGNSNTVSVFLGGTDTTAPTASVDSSQATGSSLLKTYNFTVTYTDAQQVDASTLSSANLVVTFPNDSLSEATSLVSTNLGNAAGIQATYQISFPSNLTTADNGTYAVAINANSVKNAGGVPVAAGNIGSFALAVTAGTFAVGDFAVSAPAGNFAGSVLSGSRQVGGATVKITYNGTATLTKPTLTTTLYASLTQTHDNSAVQVGAAVTTKVGTLKPGQSFKIQFAPFIYPTTAGDYYLVSDVALNGTLDSFDGATSSPITVSAPFLAFSETVTTLGLASSVVSGTASHAMAKVIIKNSGNVNSKGPVTIAISASTTSDVAGTVINSISPSPVIRANGGTVTEFVPFKALPNLADNSYYITASVTDPMGGSSVASTAGTTTIAAPFITLALAFGSIPKAVLTAGTPLIITNSGNIDDTNTFTATIGFSTDSAGVNTVGNNSGTLAPAKVTIRAGKSRTIHVTGWNPLFKSLVVPGPYFLTVTLTDAGGNSASAVSTGEI